MCVVSKQNKSIIPSLAYLRGLLLPTSMNLKANLVWIAKVYFVQSRPFVHTIRKGSVTVHTKVVVLKLINMDHLDTHIAISLSNHKARSRTSMHKYTKVKAAVDGRAGPR